MECFLNSCIFLDKLNALVKVDSESVRARANTKSGREKMIYKVDHVKYFIVWFQSRITMMIIKRKKGGGGREGTEGGGRGGRGRGEGGGEGKR